MGTEKVILRDVSHGHPPSRARLLAPLRYLMIAHPEKTRYDFIVPGVSAFVIWAGYMCLEPKPAIFGEDGLLRFVRDLLMMAVPFMIGALAAVAMGSPGEHLDKRPAGVELYLDGRLLTLRSFMCYLLGYLSFLGLITLGFSVLAVLVRPTVLHGLTGLSFWVKIVYAVGALGIFTLLSFLTVTVFWALYFLTDVVNRK